MKLSVDQIKSAVANNNFNFLQEKQFYLKYGKLFLSEKKNDYISYKSRTCISIVLFSVDPFKILLKQGNEDIDYTFDDLGFSNHYFK